MTVRVNATAITPPGGLIGWWTGDSNTVDLVSGSTATPGTTTYTTNAEVGAAFNLNGTSATVSAPDSSQWAFGTNEFTIELWANFAANSGQRALVASDTGGGSQNKWIFWLNSGVLQFHINTPGGSSFVGTAPFTPALNQWYHLAVTRQNTNYVFYVNGTSVSTNNDTRAVPDANAPLTIGSAEGSLFFNGQLDEVSIYNRALSSGEVASIATAATDGKDKTLYNSPNTYWAAPISGDWNVATNWTPNRVPRAFDKVWVTNSGTFAVSISNNASADTLFMGLAATNVTGTRTLNYTAGSFTLTNATLETNTVMNFSGGALTVRGLVAAKGGLNWTAGSIDGGGELRGGSSVGVANVSGAGAKSISGATYGNDSYAGTWSGANPTLSAGATIYNTGALTMTNDQTFAYSSGTAVSFINYGAFYKTGGSGQFLLSSIRFHNSGAMNINSGSLALTAVTATNVGGLILGSSSQLLFNSGTLQLGGTVIAPTTDSVRFIGGTVTVVTPNITSPSIWLAGATLLQQTNISVNAINESDGFFQLDVPCALNQLNQTNGYVQGRNLTVTNWNWYTGYQVRGTPGVNANDDRTIIPPGGVLNLLGAADHTLTYYSGTGPSRTLDNLGTINWSGACILYSYGTVNNYGTVTVSASGTAQYASVVANQPPTWNNFGTFTRNAGTLFYFNHCYLNNSGLLDLQQGTLSIYNSTFTNLTGTVNLAANTVFQSENNSGVAFNGPSRLVAPTADSIRLGGAFAVIETTNIVSPTLWQQAGTLYQRTNIVVSTINESGGYIELGMPCALNQLNQTNGWVQGRTITITNWNWYDGYHVRGVPNLNDQDDRTIIPVGGVMNYIGTADRYLTYYSGNGPSRTLDNFGTINWTGNSYLHSYGTVNNYGTVIVSGAGVPQYLAAVANQPPTWNNYGTFTRNAGTTFYFNGSYVNNSGTMDIQQGILSMYNSTFTNSTGLVNISAASIFQSENSSVVVLNKTSRIVAPSPDSIRLGGATTVIETTNIVSPTLWQQAGTLFQRTNISVAVLNESGGALQLDVPCVLSQLNQTNGVVQGSTLTVTNWNWYAGNHFRDTLAGGTSDNRTIIPVGGTMNFLGTDNARTLSYLVTAPGRTLDNFGTINWPASVTLSSYGTVNNNGAVNVTATGTAQYYSPNSTAIWNNFGSFTRSAGTLFYFQNVFLNNSGTMGFQSGTLSIYTSVFKNTGPVNVQNATLQAYASTCTNAAAITLDAASFFTVDSSGTFAFETNATLVVPAYNHFVLNGGNVYLRTTNISAPSVWVAGAGLYFQTNNVFSTVNMSLGGIQMDVPITLNQLNQTNGVVQGRTLTVTNWNWYAGNHFRDTLAGGAGDNRTIIPVGGTMNFLGTDGARTLSYLVTAPGRTLDNFGTINWSAAVVLSSYGTVNNYGSVNVSAVGVPQYYSPAPASVPSIWNNYGTFTRSAGTLFYFQGGFINNSGTMDLQAGTTSIYNSTFTNSTGLVNVGASGVFQSEVAGGGSSFVTLGSASQVVAPTANSLRFAGTTTAIETTNIVSPSIWLVAGTLFQRTNIVVSTINESGGALQLEVPATLNQLNQTNGTVQGRSLTVTNWNWYAGNHFRDTGAGGTNDNRTIIPVGGTMNFLGTDGARTLSYLVTAPGRTLDNFGTINWSAAVVFSSYGTVNNYGSVNVSAVGVPQYYSPNSTAIWNNFGSFTRTGGTLFYFQSVFLNNYGTLDLQAGTVSVYNSSTFTNQSGGNVLVQPGAVLANDLNSVSFYEAGSSLACASSNAFQINSGTVTLRTPSITAPSLWINGGTLNQNTNNAVNVVNETVGTWQLNVPITVDTYNLTNGDVRGANLTLNNFNWQGGTLYATGAGSNLVTVNNRINISSGTAKTMSYLTVQPGRSLINNGTATWGGSGIIGSGGATFFNNGTLTLTNDFGFAWGGSGNVSVFQNAGTFTKSAGTGTATFSSTVFTNTGTIAINSGGLAVGGLFMQTAGSSFLGTNFTANADVWIKAGSLTGKGSIAGAFYNSGIVNPGASPGFINGNTFTNTSVATFNMEIGGNNGPGTNYDQMRFSGPVTLDGTLNVTLYTNYALILSNRFTVLTTSARSGTFANVIPPPGATLNTIYSTTNVVLEVAGLTNAPLQILTNPVSQTIWTPDPVTLSVVVSGVTPISFQWQLNGTNISGATASAYAIPAVAVTNAGVYTVLITDGVGGTTNASATLTVIPFANTIWWTNVLGGNWSVAANWLPNRVPNGGNNAMILSNGTYTVNVDVAAAVSNLTVGTLGATGTPTVHLISGQSLTVNGSTSWETNAVLALNGLLQMNGGSNNVRGHIDWQLGTLSGAGRTVISTNASLTFIGSLNQKFIVTNALENYGTFNYGNDSFGNAQGLRFSGGAQLTNYASGVISIGTGAFDYSGSQTPRSYFVNYGTVNANSSGVFSPTYISIDFINYGTLQDNGYVYLSRGTNYGTFSWGNTLCEVSVFGDESTGEYFSFENGTTFVGTYPSLAVGGYAQWNATSIHPGKVTVFSGSGGASFASPEFRILKNYTQSGQTFVYKGRWTQANPAITADLNELTDGLVSGFHTFVITNNGTLRANTFSHGVRNLANSGVIVVRSNLVLSGSSATYGGGTIMITNRANATFSGGSVDAQTILNFGTNVVSGGMAFSGGTFYRNYASARTYFGGGSFSGPSSLLNEGLLDGFGGLAITAVTNRGTVLADVAGGNLALGVYRQESGLTDLNPGSVSGALDIVGGILSGTNTVTGSVRNASTILPGRPFGLLTVTGNYTNTAGATYFLPIAGRFAITNFPQTSVQGTSVLAGTLFVNFTNGFNPAPGNLFTAMVFTARSGVFDSIVNDTYGLEAFYTPTQLVLRAQNLLPNVTLTVAGGNTQLVCQTFGVTASATDPDGVVTNLTVTLNGSPVRSTTGATIKTVVDSDFPTQLMLMAQATDDRGGVRTVTVPVDIYNFSQTNKLFLGGVRSNDFKICMVGEPGRNYEVYGITNLPATNWIDLGTMIQSNSTWRYVDQRTITNRPYRFYRTQQLP